MYQKNYISRQDTVLSRVLSVGVAAVWNDRKGLDDYIKLASILPDQYLIILVGLTLEQQNNLPKNIFGIQRTHNQYELA